ncbi:hypothetical protein SODALDRAFT_349802 [Sodiomyces alkalinus F11]|uniref:Copper transport protein n=1 Tax=Sodiomyces alkalinus (strain CBS 110278 / VKM F-3762 / F11) TaxID=1314773 RepID=A0A3N2PYQ8_SODAK|nr:hypothetical protein SODALDRAFT_349802 [Sodiomyces alkalinus F11]ROT39622.1 hypothetical protein SODALDRAFT_349802 [Sodiomyces alkalinus F11]
MAFEGLRRASTELDCVLLQAHVSRCERERDALRLRALEEDGGGSRSGRSNRSGRSRRSVPRGNGGNGGDDGGHTSFAAGSADNDVELDFMALNPRPGDGGRRIALDLERCYEYRGFPPYRPSFIVQLGRTVLHTLRIISAYFLVLLSMYYNGYIILCIFAGAFLGHFMFHWEKVSSVTDRNPAEDDPDTTTDRRRQDHAPNHAVHANKQRGRAKKRRRGF